MRGDAVEVGLEVAQEHDVLMVCEVYPKLKMSFLALNGLKLDA